MPVSYTHLDVYKRQPKYYQKVFFSSINYDENVVNKRQQIPVQNLDYYDILLITGIANPTLVENELKRYTHRIKPVSYTPLDVYKRQA